MVCAAKAATAFREDAASVLQGSAGSSAYNLIAHLGSSGACLLRRSEMADQGLAASERGGGGEGLQD